MSIVAEVSGVLDITFLVNVTPMLPLVHEPLDVTSRAWNYLQDVVLISDSVFL